MKNIKIFTLGGTIAMRGQSGGACPAVSGRELVAALDIDSGAIQLDVEGLMNVASGHLTMADIYALSEKIAQTLEGGSDGVVVIQGTDTIEETAFALDLLHGAAAPVIVTGAMRLASAQSADGPGNIRSALLVAADVSARGRGVMVVFNDCIHEARLVVKTHTCRVDTFQSRDGGPCALVRDRGIDWYSGPPARKVMDRPRAAWSRVPLIKSYLGDEGVVIDALFNAEIQGLVVEGLGGGHLHPSAADKIQVLARHMPVVLTTRCQGGPTLVDTYGYVGGEIDLARRGLITCRYLSGVKARVALTVLRDLGATTDAVRTFFED